MRAERVASEPGKPSTKPLTFAATTLACFALGFGILVALPRVWPRYVQVPAVVDAVPERPMEVGTAPPPAPPVPGTPVPGVVTPIKRSAVPATQKIAAYGVSPSLADCKTAIAAGRPFEGVTPDQIAATFDARGKPTGAQIDTACRELTE